MHTILMAPMRHTKKIFIVVGNVSAMHLPNNDYCSPNYDSNSLSSLLCVSQRTHWGR